MIPDTSPALAAIAAYAESVLAATDAESSPWAELGRARDGLRNIADECRRESETTPTEKESHQ